MGKLIDKKIVRPRKTRAKVKGRIVDSLTSAGTIRKDVLGVKTIVTGTVRGRTPRAGEPDILDRAIEVIGTADDAMRWMGTPIRALDYATPISVIHTAKGRESVLAVLTNLDHGVL
ncbi:MAG: DUF2384 domain-containing protein [Bryobacteraceae bacterium]|nr:DUF2384 domain-containing protein [Bryobacteraceae bacterium]